MDLILWRHAEAEAAIDRTIEADAAGAPTPGEADDTGLARSDAARVLTSKGMRHAARVGAWLDRQLPEGCRVFASPTVRCIQTADGLGRRYSLSGELAPNSSAERMRELCGWPGHRFPALLVGHQPLLGELAALLLTGQEQPWKLRKGSLLWIRGGDGDEPPYIRLAVGPDMVGKLR